MNSRGQKFHCGQLSFGADEISFPEIQALLERAWGEKTPVFCSCRPEGVRVVTRRHRGHVFIARWPSTGTRHDVACPSYDPYSQSGAVIEHADGSVEIKTSLQFSRRHPHQHASTSPPPSAAVVEGPLSAAGVLRELWRMASLDRWYPKMAGKRQWGVIRGLLQSAALPVQIGSEALADRLVIPRPYKNSNREGHIRDEKEGIEKALQENGSAILIAPIAGIVQSEHGFRINFTHLHGISFFASKALPASVINSPYPANGRRVGIAVIFPSERGRYFHVEYLGVMPVSAEWLPSYSKRDNDLIQELNGMRCGFIVHAGCRGFDDRLATILRHNRESMVIRSAKPGSGTRWECVAVSPNSNQETEEK